MDDGVPGEAGIVDYAMDLAVAKLSSLLDELLDAVVLEQVSADSESLAALGPDLGRRGFGLDAVNVGHDHLGALIGKQPRAFGADALGGAGDDGDLAREQPLGEVELAGDLVDSFRHGDTRLNSDEEVGEVMDKPEPNLAGLRILNT